MSEVDVIKAMRVNGKRIPPASHRGITVSTSPADGAPAPRRDDNWTLRRSSRDVVPRTLRAVELSGGFMTKPFTVLVGDVLEIECPLEETMDGRVADGATDFPAVPGTVRYFDANDAIITDPALYGDASTTRYMATMTLMVLDWSFGGNTLAKTTTWKLSCEMVEPL